MQSESGKTPHDDLADTGSALASADDQIDVAGDTGTQSLDDMMDELLGQDEVAASAEEEYQNTQPL